VSESYGCEINNKKYDGRLPLVKILLANELKNDVGFKKKMSFLFENLYHELSRAQVGLCCTLREIIYELR
jgi:hypothetical protein